MLARRALIAGSLTVLAGSLAGRTPVEAQPARVYQVGYLFNGQLLRPARVVVKQWNG